MSYKDSEFKQKQTKSQLSIRSNEIKTKTSIDESFNISSTIIKKSCSTIEIVYKSQTLQNEPIPRILRASTKSKLGK